MTWNLDIESLSAGARKGTLSYLSIFV